MRRLRLQHDGRARDDSGSGGGRWLARAVMESAAMAGKREASLPEPLPVALGEQPLRLSEFERAAAREARQRERYHRLAGVQPARARPPAGPVLRTRGPGRTAPTTLGGRDARPG